MYSLCTDNVQYMIVHQMQVVLKCEVEVNLGGVKNRMRNSFVIKMIVTGTEFETCNKSEFNRTLC